LILCEFQKILDVADYLSTYSIHRSQSSHSRRTYMSDSTDHRLLSLQPFLLDLSFFNCGARSVKTWIAFSVGFNYGIIHRFWSNGAISYGFLLFVEYLQSLNDNGFQFGYNFAGFGLTQWSVASAFSGSDATTNTWTPLSSLLRIGGEGTQIGKMVSKISRVLLTRFNWPLIFRATVLVLVLFIFSLDAGLHPKKQTFRRNLMIRGYRVLHNGNI
jgi:hypothetical protein